MQETLTRRTLLGRVGLALGGAMTAGALQSCGEDESATTVPATQQLADFPYGKHLASGYTLQAAAVQEAAYHQYYAGGCCHGAYNALVKHLADTAGAPFTLLPLDFGMFGGGGIASYGSICGAVLGGLIVINYIVPEVAAPAGTAAAELPRYSIRSRMMTELLRWYESFAFPAYHPAALDAKETESSLTRAFNDAGKLPVIQVVPGSHLCHASVTGWCTANGNVSASGGDKKARCARLTADVAGKVVQLLNVYLSTHELPTTGLTASQTGDCSYCHAPAPTRASQPQPVAAGMACTSCHPVDGASNDWVHPLPTVTSGGSPLTHTTETACGGCHHP